MDKNWLLANTELPQSRVVCAPQDGMFRVYKGSNWCVVAGHEEWFEYKGTPLLQAKNLPKCIILKHCNSTTEKKAKYVGYMLAAGPSQGTYSLVNNLMASPTEPFNIIQHLIVFYAYLSNAQLELRRGHPQQQLELYPQRRLELPSTRGFELLSSHP
ncbi:hypothetical protein PM082_024112 [Marasmius tenuissimus]|nr:hypothetical protein PM082_024112 [Marasmius tenuissimus]